MVAKEVSTVSPSIYYSHIDCFCLGNSLPIGDLEAIKKIKKNGNFRVSLVGMPRNIEQCGYCQLPIR